MGHTFLKIFWKIFLIKSWNAIEHFSFIANTKKKLCLFEVGGRPKSPLPLSGIGLNGY